MNDYFGSDFDEFLKQEGLLAEVEAVALARLSSYSCQQATERPQMELVVELA